ncbi:hypothetical protein ON010_g13522 [Phytophthora cinnamomi]|nr:hypothetical protein ON010_g13522 [Phytophthora cinnamomi]
MAYDELASSQQEPGTLRVEDGRRCYRAALPLFPGDGPVASGGELACDGRQRCGASFRPRFKEQYVDPGSA